MKNLRSATEEKKQSEYLSTRAYHGIIVDASLDDQKILSTLNVLSSKKDGGWTLYKVEVPDERIEETLELLRTSLKMRFYAHFYRGEELIVVFKDSIFRTTIRPTDWINIKNHGKKLDIPHQQLDFNPCRIQDETW